MTIRKRNAEMSVKPSQRLPAQPDIATLPSIQVEERPKWRSNPERLAWFVLLFAFFVFVVLAISIPAAINYTIRYAAVPQSARLNSTVGTLLLYPPKAEEPIAITGSRDDISEGSRIVTTGSGSQGTQGVLGFAEMPDSDQLLGTVHLYAGTELEVLKIRRPRFERSPEPYQIRLRLTEGRVRLFTNSSDRRPLLVTLETPHGETILGEGSYNFLVTADHTDVSVRSGRAELIQNGGERVVVEPGLRSWMTVDSPPAEPISAERNLIENGDFSQPLLDTWQTYTEARYTVPGTVEIKEQDGRRVAHFVRQGEEGIHTEVGIRQEIDQDVNSYDYLAIHLDVKLIRQTLRGAGEESSEFPLRVEIAYTDIYGKDLKWGYGFYYREPDPNWPPIYGEQIAPFVWYSYETENLMELLKDTRPAHINSIRIYASGWNYESMVSEISLIAE